MTALRTLPLALLIACLPQLASAQGRSEDIETPPPPPPIVQPQERPAPSLPWYQPSREEEFKKPEHLTSRYPDEKRGGFGLGFAFEAGTAVDQSLDHIAGMLRLQTSVIGIDLGALTQPGWNESSGTGFLAGLAVPVLSIRLLGVGRHHLYFGLPEFNARVAILSGFNGMGLTVLLGGSVVGLRYSVCLGPISLFVDLRGPTLYANIDLEHSNLSVQLGGRGTLGIAF